MVVRELRLGAKREPLVPGLHEPVRLAPDERERGAEQDGEHRDLGGGRAPGGAAGEDGAPGDGGRPERLVDRERRAEVHRAEPEELERRRDEEAALQVAKRPADHGRKGDRPRKHGLEEALAFDGGEARNESQDEVTQGTTV